MEPLFPRVRLLNQTKSWLTSIALLLLHLNQYSDPQSAIPKEQQPVLIASKGSVEVEQLLFLSSVCSSGLTIHIPICVSLSRGPEVVNLVPRDKIQDFRLLCVGRQIQLKLTSQKVLNRYPGVPPTPIDYPGSPQSECRSPSATSSAVDKVQWFRCSKNSGEAREERTSSSFPSSSSKAEASAAVPPHNFQVSTEGLAGLAPPCT